MRNFGLCLFPLFCIVLFNTTCSNEDIQPNNSKSSEIIATAKTFGERHNQGLAYIYNELIKQNLLHKIRIN